MTALLAALLALESGAGTEADVYERLLEDQVLIPMAPPMQFMTVPTDDGRLAVPVFSDPRALAVWGEPPEYAWTGAADCCASSSAAAGGAAHASTVGA